MKTKHALALMLSTFAAIAGAPGRAATPLAIDPPITLTIQTDQVRGKVSPTLYGLMTEEINFSYDGGLYAELIRNRTFQDSASEPVRWSLVASDAAKASIALDKSEPLNSSLPVSLKLDASHASYTQRVGIANEGFWGIPVRPSTTYRASFYAKASAGFKGPLTVAIETADSHTTIAHTDVADIGPAWKKYTATLTTPADIKTSSANVFTISTTSPGTLNFNLVSLFPPTFNNRPNGNRTDIMQLLVDMKPQFLRFPGGNYVEGNSFPDRFNWKATIGDLANRPTHNSPWRYRSSDGLGLLEFLEWTEDMHGQPVMAVFAGYVLGRAQPKFVTGDELKPYVQDALDEIEYVTGDSSTKWGAQRIADGHPAPFPLKYVEVGNEDPANTYDARFTAFYDAIKAKYPQIQIIATTRTTTRTADVIDEHAYFSTAEAAERQAHRFDRRSRDSMKVFMGEWATRLGRPTTNFNAALADAAFMTGLERNSDLVIMSCYAPLFVNVNPGGMQWPSNLIGYNALTSYGSPSYHVQKMFSTYLGDTLPVATIENVPTYPPAGAADAQPTGVTATPATPAATAPASAQAGGAPGRGNTGPVDQIYYTVTKNSKTGMLYLKMVNISDGSMVVQIELKGATNVANEATCIQFTGGRTDTNSINESEKIAPVTSKVNGIAPSFSYTFPARSITLLQIETH